MKTGLCVLEQLGYLLQPQQYFIWEAYPKGKYTFVLLSRFDLPTEILGLENIFISQGYYENSRKP